MKYECGFECCTISAFISRYGATYKKVRISRNGAVKNSQVCINWSVSITLGAFNLRQDQHDITKLELQKSAPLHTIITATNHDNQPVGTHGAMFTDNSGANVIFD
jgi:hypothetical protein